MRIIVNVDVPDLAPAIEFYSRAWGLHLNRIIDDDVAEMAGATVLIYLLAKPSGSVAAETIASARCYTRHWTPVHLDFVVDDIAQACTQALDAGAQQESECVEWRGSKCITFSDPFGHGFCLIEFSEGNYRDDMQNK